MITAKHRCLKPSKEATSKWQVILKWKFELFWIWISANLLQNSELLLENGADVDTKGNDGVSVLQKMILNGWYFVLVSVSWRDLSISLHIWIWKCLENVELVELLLENGADVNIRYANSGKTPLYVAVEKGFPVIALQSYQIEFHWN